MIDLTKKDFIILALGALLVILFQTNHLQTVKPEVQDQERKELIREEKGINEMQLKNRKAHKEATPEAKEMPENTRSQKSGVQPANNGVLCPTQNDENCSQECIQNPPFICGSDGKTYCNTCQACSQPNVRWYTVQNELCKDLSPTL